jgi:transcriptional regulator with XRE-family HTH domain
MQETKETIGQRLKQIRLSRQISIEKAAEATRVRVIYLQALEADNYSVMSSAAQSRGFLHLYADFLGLDLEAAMSELQQAETVDAPPSTPAPAPVTLPPAPVAAPQTPPASSADGKPVRRAFWARLLRRPFREPVPEAESAPEAAPVAVVVPEPVIVPEPEPAPARAKKSTATSSLAKHPEGAKGKKAKAPAADKPKSKPKPAAKIPAKKKASLKNRR